MRIFYLEHQKMHYQTDRDTVLILLREQAVYEGYTPEQLVKWKNLTPIQDPRKPRTKAAQRQRIPAPFGTSLDILSPRRCGFKRRSLRRPFRNSVLGRPL